MTLGAMGGLWQVWWPYLVLLVVLVAAAGVWRVTRRRIRRAVRRRMSVTARRTLRRFRARIDRFKLMRHADVRDALLNDRTLTQAVAVAAADDVDPDVQIITHQVRDRVEHYLQEIIPSFNILSYFRIGYATARLVLGSLYFVDTDPKDMDRLRQMLADRKRTFLFLINHRSNADFVLLGLVFAQRVALSYAVGEWARVWPLEPLFKSFGSYFVRRGERDPTYHTVLSRYVQYVTIKGVTQGVFLEGGLSRDGAFRAPRIGLLDSIITAKADPSFSQELVIVPICISYDRVLEDETLMLEAFGSRPQRWQRRSLLYRQARKVAGYLFSQVHLFLMERQRKFGHAAVRVGEPISVDRWLEEHPDWLNKDRTARKDELQALAEQVMDGIGKTLAILPAPVLCSVLHERRALPEAEARSLFEARVADLRARGAKTWLPRRQVKDPFRLAKSMLLRRGVLTSVEGALVVKESARPLMEYYARSLMPWLQVDAGTLQEQRPTAGA